MAEEKKADLPPNGFFVGRYILSSPAAASLDRVPHAMPENA
jgi:hypothetical protein